MFSDVRKVKQTPATQRWTPGAQSMAPAPEFVALPKQAQAGRRQWRSVAVLKRHGAQTGPHPGGRTFSWRSLPSVRDMSASARSTSRRRLCCSSGIGTPPRPRPPPRPRSGAPGWSPAAPAQATPPSSVPSTAHRAAGDQTAGYSARLCRPRTASCTGPCMILACRPTHQGPCVRSRKTGCASRDVARNYIVKKIARLGSLARRCS